MGKDAAHTKLSSRLDIFAPSGCSSTYEQLQWWMKNVSCICGCLGSLEVFGFSRHFPFPFDWALLGPRSTSKISCWFEVSGQAQDRWDQNYNLELLCHFFFLFIVLKKQPRFLQGFQSPLKIFPCYCFRFQANLRPPLDAVHLGRNYFISSGLWQTWIFLWSPSFPLLL